MTRDPTISGPPPTPPNGPRLFRRLSTDARDGLFGLGWSYLTHGLQTAIKFASSLILTRLLVPEAYGIFGTALAVAFFLEFLSDIGLRPAIVRSVRGEDPAFLGTAWSIVLIRSVGLSAAMVGLAWVLPVFHEMPELHWVLLALAGRPILVALINPTLNVLYRRVQYRTLFFLDIGQSLLAVPATILLAWSFGDVRALVFGLLFGDVVRVVLSHVLCPAAPKLAWDREGVRELSHFGYSIFVNTLFFGAWIYFDRLIGPRALPRETADGLGSVVTAATLMGLYMTAWSLAEALDNLIGRGGDVFYSLLARKPEAERREFFQRSAVRASLYLLPILALGAVTAPWVFRLLYRKPFHGAAVLLGLLIARLILRTVSHIQFSYLLIRNEVRIATRAYLISLAIMAATFQLWVDHFGVQGIAFSTVVGMATFTVTQSVQMMVRREIGPGPVLLGLFWSAVAVAGVVGLS